ncbi:glycosyltransferase family 2 protein [Jannaschia sp. LMIT008]|uniref:glycosyltransferase family 2 protein n=1 Tax=Jannaschia maritima TaxID=3032585 RepID=UPI0028113143|nr:glycosyltransferase [Jannaschia sp. LMIT008]
MTEPQATIVLPSFGRPAHVRDCLAALGALDGGPYPVVVVDDGSPEPLAPVCAPFGDAVRCIRQDNAGPGVARNRGVAEARTRLVLFIDDDCRPEPGWARALIETQAGDPDALVGGLVVNGLDRNVWSDAAQAILTYSYGAFGGFDGRLAFFTTNNLCVDRDRFLDLGGFDASYAFASEDRDLSFRWKAAGGHLRHAPDAVVTHLHAMTGAGFLRQQYAYGRGARRFHGRVRDSGTGSVEMGGKAFYAGLLLHPLRRPTPRAVVRSVLIGTAHAAMLAGYLRERRAEGSGGPRRPTGDGRDA